MLGLLVTFSWEKGKTLHIIFPLRSVLVELEHQVHDMQMANRSSMPAFAFESTGNVPGQSVLRRLAESSKSSNTKRECRSAEGKGNDAIRSRSLKRDPLPLIYLASE